MWCGYILKKSLINKFTYDICKVLGSFMSNYDNSLIVGYLNSEVTESSMHEFCNGYNFHSLCHKSNCYQNTEKHHALTFF